MKFDSRVWSSVRLYRTSVMILSIAISMLASSSAVAGAESGPTEFYLLLGQSNMGGMAPAEPDDGQLLDRVYSMDAWEHWEQRSLVSDGGTIGPSLGFASSMISACTNKSIGIVTIGPQGSLMVQWSKGTPYYDAVMRWARAGKKTSRLAGVLWQQGESDCLEQGHAAHYEARLSQFITDLRKDLADPALPFIIGQLPPEFSEKNQAASVINSAFEAVATNHDAVFVISSSGLTTLDGTHYDRASQLRLGQMFADRIREVSADSGCRDSDTH